MQLHLFSHDYTTFSYIHFPSRSLFCTVSFSLHPESQIFTQPQLSISFTYSLTMQHVTQFLATAPLCSSSSYTLLFLTLIHELILILYLFFILYSVTFTHSFSHTSFTFLRLHIVSPKAPFSQFCCSSLLLLHCHSQLLTIRGCFTGSDLESKHKLSHIVSLSLGMSWWPIHVTLSW